MKVFIKFTESLGFLKLEFKLIFSDLVFTFSVLSIGLFFVPFRKKNMNIRCKKNQKLCQKLNTERKQKSRPFHESYLT